MACNCWAMPRKAKKHSFLVIMVDSVTNQEGQCVVQLPCSCGIQELMTEYARKGQLQVIDPRDRSQYFTMDNPVVTHVDAKIASHIPIVDPAL